MYQITFFALENPNNLNIKAKTFKGFFYKKQYHCPDSSLPCLTIPQQLQAFQQYIVYGQMLGLKSGLIQYKHC